MSVATVFRDVFGHVPEAEASAPGRVNLMGEHTDYNAGLVLPTTIPQRTHVAVAHFRSGTQHEAYSQDLVEHASFGQKGPLAGFARYVGGCLRVLEQTGTVIPALRLAIASDVPIGAGLSSSAALEVATIRALFRLFGRAEDPAEIAHLAWQAEVQHAGVSCGVLDQMAVSFGAPHRMLFLDTATEEHRLLPLPPGSEILVVDSGIRRKLSGSAYNLRREECRQAAASLGADTLSAPGLDLRLVESRLLPPLLGRARHVISENARVNAALSASAEAFGRLMNESHASLRDDFEVSLPALDRLAESLQSEPEVFGAKLTGAGFGGACVALVPTGRAQAVGRRVCARQPPDSGSHWQVVVPPLCPAGGPMVS